MTVSELLGRISAHELTEWMAFFTLEPFGTEIDLLGHAITASTIANANRGKGKRPYTPADFMPDFDKVHKKQSTEEMIQVAETLTAVFGGKDLRNKQ